MTTIGNSATGRYSTLTGSGTAHRKIPFGHLTISGKSGDIVRVTCTEFCNAYPQLYILTQASIGSVKVSRTIADVDLAVSPDQDTGDHWIVDHTAAPGAINQTETLATCLKLEFLADAIIYITGV
jgi:hypothetical protein